MKGSRSIKILILSVALTLTFLLSYQIVYSYFTTQKNASGNINMGDLSVSFAYNSDGVFTTLTNTQSYEVSPNAASLNRGDTFTFLTTDNKVIDGLYFYITSNSCDCYIRFFINAYIVENDEPNTSKNYGQYFQMNGGGTNYTSEPRTENGVTNVVYFYQSAQTTSLGSYKTIGNSITLLNTAPNELLDSVVRITITFDAVQAANEAFKAEFDDGWGYLSSWT